MAVAESEFKTHPSNPRLLDAPPLLVGVGGMLWRAWDRLLEGFKIPHASPSLAELDLTKPESIDRAIPAGCRLVINCAAYTDVDKAEAEEPLANIINGTGVGDLARICRQRQALLVHYSTDYVFDGNKRPCLPDDPRKPMNAYGRTKALGEKLIEDSGCEFLILRTSWLYAPWAKNFVRTIAKFARENRPLKIVDDQRGRPTSAEHLARMSLELVERNARGIYHVTDGGDCTWFDFAREIARHVNPECQISPWTTAELNRPAPRPSYSVLDLAKTEALLGPMPDWKLATANVIGRLEES